MGGLLMRHYCRDGGTGAHPQLAACWKCWCSRLNNMRRGLRSAHDHHDHNYVIIAVGAMTVFGSLGVSWDKLRWLAAALSVGLGFGLQEIFGNFVSGLIITLQRTSGTRGDTVTIAAPLLRHGQ